jgi:hypothetical protein
MACGFALRSTRLSPRRSTCKNCSAGLDNTISRLSSVSDPYGTLESYSYLGLDTVVKRAHPQPNVDLTYIKQTGEANRDADDQYIGLDRFDRVLDVRWRKGDGTHTDRFVYGHDRNSNRLYRANWVDGNGDGGVPATPGRPLTRADRDLACFGPTSLRKPQCFFA